MAKNWALVIGINGYNRLNFTPLRYAKHDAEAVKAFFETMGFEVCCFTDDSPPLMLPNGVEIETRPTYGNLITFLEDRFKNPFLSTGDNCWFFFAGHGERHADKDYLMPMDGNARGRKEIAGLQVDEVREWLTRSGADNVILLLDACRSEGSRGRGMDFTEQKGVITIASCNPTEKSWEIEELGQGAFTYALLEALQLPGERSCATVERLSNYLRSRVPELCCRYAKPTQTPRISVDPLEKQHFILMPQFARQSDIDLMKQYGFRLAFENKLQLAEQMFIRANAAASGRDREILDALTEVRMRMKTTTRTRLPTPRTNLSRTASPSFSISLHYWTRRRLLWALGLGSMSIMGVATGLVINTLELPPTPEPSPSPTPELSPSPTPEPSPSPATTSDYPTLERLLQAQQWREANEETRNIMLRVAGNEQIETYSAFNFDSITNFPCDVLVAIDQLWVQYSNGKFGFSVQQRIWEEVGSPTEYNVQWEEFGDRVGWRKTGQWMIPVELTFDLSRSSTGELPGWEALEGRQCAGSRVYCGWFVLFSRAENCAL